jgi:hypothetical protein
MEWSLRLGGMRAESGERGELVRSATRRINELSAFDRNGRPGDMVVRARGAALDRKI